MVLPFVYFNKRIEMKIEGSERRRRVEAEAEIGMMENKWLWGLDSEYR